MAMLAMFGFEFLLRVQSEGLVVFKGENDDYLELKKDNQPNAVWMADDGKLVFRMRQRKNRQTGSLLLRSCTCDNPKVPYCMVCKMKVFLERFQVGEMIWTFTSREFMAKCKEGLSANGAAVGSQLLSFKSWRAGKATELVKAGAGVGEVLQSGDWSSASFLRYAQVELLDPNVIDPQKVVWEACEVSDEEDEKAAMGQRTTT